MSDEMRRDPPIYAPNALARVRAKSKELTEAVKRGEITAEEAKAAYKTFASLTIAHVREHGPENA